EHQPPADDALDVDAVMHELRLGQDLTRELELTEPECPAGARCARPAQVEPEHLPQRVQAQAARHDGIAFEMAIEKPEVWSDVELGPDKTLVEGTARAGDLGDPVE